MKLKFFIMELYFIFCNVRYVLIMFFDYPFMNIYSKNK